MIDIALINPSVGFSERRKSIPIGLAYIIAYLRGNGYTAAGYDFGDSVTPADELVEKYGIWRHDVVGMSIYNESFATGLKMAEAIRSRNPRCFILMGGPQATATHETVVRNWHVIDGVIRREGELPTLSLVQALERGSALADVPNLTWRDENGAVQVNCEIPAVEDLDSLPYPAASFTSEYPYPTLHYYDRVRDELRPALTINTSRSCPYNCSFCGVLTIGRRYRSRSPLSVTQELEYFRELHGLDYRHIYFSDANFFVRAERALGIVQALHKFDDRITFSFGTRVNQVLRARRVIEQMLALGLRYIEVGIENASPTVLERLAKGVDPSVNVAAVRMLNRLDVDIALDYIMIDPATTVKDLQLNIEFLEKYFLDYYPHEHFYTSLALYEGTPIREFYEERRGSRFASGSLPATRDVLELPEIVAWWDVSQLFRTQYQQEIDATLAKCEVLLSHPMSVRALTRGPGPRAELSQLQLDVVSLKHAPTIFFRRLIDCLAMAERPRSPEDIDLGGFGTKGTSLRALLADANDRLISLREQLGISSDDLEHGLEVSGAVYE